MEFFNAFYIEEKNIFDPILKAGHNLGHIHLNENDWGIPGSGHIEWEKLFKALQTIQYKGYASMECVVDFQGNFVWRELAPNKKTLLLEGITYFKGLMSEE